MHATADGTDAWLTTDEVAQRLNLKKATVYAYVSRGLLSAQRRGRESRFRLSEVEALARERHPSRSPLEAGASRIFEMVDGEPTYRGTSAIDLARSRTFEEVTDLLWGAVPSDESPAWPPPDERESAVVAAALDALPPEVMFSDKLKTAVAILGAIDGPGSSYYAPEVIESSRQLLVTAVGGQPRLAPGGGSKAQGAPSRPIPFAQLLWERLTPAVPSPDEVAMLDAALVLAAEHGMAPSTTVARTAASFGATVYGVVGAGMGAGTNDVQGASALIVEDMLRGIRDARQSLRGLVELARIQGHMPGFGHHAHPEGDARAQHLLERLERVAEGNPRYEEIRSLSQVMTDRGLEPPNLYFALASIVHCYDMERGATEGIFALGRSAGWIAHAIDEYVRNGRRRPSST